MWSDVAIATQVCVCKLTVPLKQSQIIPFTPPQIYQLSILYTPFSPTTVLRYRTNHVYCNSVVLCGLYQSPYRITVEDIILIHLHNFEWYMLTRIHNIE